MLVVLWNINRDNVPAHDRAITERSITAAGMQGTKLDELVGAGSLVLGGVVGTARSMFYGLLTVGAVVEAQSISDLIAPHPYESSLGNVPARRSNGHGKRYGMASGPFWDPEGN
jgi:hypothetical protein